MANEYTSNADIQSAESRRAANEQQSALFKALMLQRMQGEQGAQHQQVAGEQNSALSAQQAQQAQEAARQKDALGQAGVQRNISTLKDLIGSGKMPAGSGASIGENGNVGITKGGNPFQAAQLNERHENNITKEAEDYRNHLEKTQGFASSLQDLENVTNKLNGGKGGIITNGDYMPRSGGKVASGIPSTGLGGYILSAGEASGALPPGAMEERKAAERFRLEYQKSMTGMRTTSEMADREAKAMGMATSPDPQLMAKGTRALAKLAKDRIALQQSPYHKEALDRVHDRVGDPLTAFPKVYDDNNTSATASSSAPGDAASAQAAPAAPAMTPRQRLEYLRKGGK